MIFWSKNMATCQIWKWESLWTKSNTISWFKEKKDLDKLEIEGNFHNKKKTLTEKLTCNITLSDERLDVFPIFWKTRCLELTISSTFYIFPHLLSFYNTKAHGTLILWSAPKFFLYEEKICQALPGLPVGSTSMCVSALAYGPSKPARALGHLRSP